MKLFLKTYVELSGKGGIYLYKGIIHFILYTVINILFYIIVYFASLKPLLITATSLNFDTGRFLLFTLVLIFISIVLGFIIKKIILFHSHSTKSTTNEIVLYIFSNILTILILYYIASF